MNLAFNCLETRNGERVKDRNIVKMENKKKDAANTKIHARQCWKIQYCLKALGVLIMDLLY
jgi:hypothetical protein